jgi:hypothetical protein
MEAIDLSIGIVPGVIKPRKPSKGADKKDYVKKNEFTSKSKSWKGSRKRSYSKSYKSKSSRSSSNSSSDFGHFKYQIGDVINKKYRIEEFLGDGTFGRVLEVKSLDNNEFYAIKV